MVEKASKTYSPITPSTSSCRASNSELGMVQGDNGIQIVQKLQFISWSSMIFIIPCQKSTLEYVKHHKLFGIAYASP